MKKPHTESGIQMPDERIAERLRQERETFDQHRAHENRWFFLRLVMGYASVLLLVSIMVVSSYILLNNASFPVAVVTYAGAALFVDVLGLLVAVWRVVFNQNFMTKLAPVTQNQSLDVPGDNAKIDLARTVAQKELIILSAAYGVKGKMVDVTQRVRSKIEGKLEFLVCNALLVDEDPVPGTVKYLEVTYSYAGQTHSIKVRENDTLLLP